jgi:serine/threonine-protein kinase
MELAPGARLGVYEILSPLGAGGMGEVFRARDTRLGREVAIKVLPAAFAGDADRMARFQREAHLLASLNHPGIATLHGLEEADSVRALVMELVPGPTLADRIGQGALPQEEALRLARQLAEALEYAHERGIVHRDLKPANVKLTPDGAVKVLDFGLAKALSYPLAADVSQSPTLSAVATRDGIVLGTAAYMSPEQAKGKPADRRSDVWSFGVVLYEMLSGRRMFSGGTAAETLAKVIEREPEWGALPYGTPPNVRRLLRRCLEKDPRRRVQAIGEVRIALEDALTGVSEEPLAGEATAGRAEARAQRALPWLLAAPASVLSLGLGLWAPWRGAPPPKAPQRLSIELGADASLFLGIGAAATMSPDGSTLAFAAAKPGAGRQLYVRRLDRETASPLVGTENARHPFFSPDGQWLGFFADGKLKKVATTGGAAVTLCDAADDRGGTWAEDGTIVFMPSATRGLGATPGLRLLRVSSDGGTPEPFTKTDPGAEGVSDRWPQALPGGRAVLFTSSSRPRSYDDDASIAVQTLPSGPRKVVHRGGYHGRYLRSGHLVYIHKGTLFAAPFDLGRLEVTGPAATAVEGVTSSADTAGAHFAFSDEGTLAYLPGRSTGVEAPIQWLDREGKTQVLRAAPSDVMNLRFSPDGRRLAMDIGDGGQRDVWVYEWERETMSRLTFDAEDDGSPVWTPDGRRIVFSSMRADKTPNLYWQAADGTGEVQRLTESKNPQFPNSWHPDGKSLAFTEITPQGYGDLMILPLQGDEATGWTPGKPAAFLASRFAERIAAFSPDGRWLAYESNETGRFEVNVLPFPGPGGRRQVSTGGGTFSTWSRTRKELFYQASELKLMVAAYAVDGVSFRAERPRVWSEAPFEPRGPGRTFDLHPDGQRLAVLKSLASLAEARHDRLTLVVGFADELRRIAPARKR